MSDPDCRSRLVHAGHRRARANRTSLEVDGTPIHYLSWNAADTDKPALLFAHGFRAHARWWSFIAPFFLSRFRVVSMDFAGMGDSGNRSEYTPLGFVRDIVGVLDHAGFAKATLDRSQLRRRPRRAGLCASFRSESRAQSSSTATCG